MSSIDRHPILQRQLRRLGIDSSPSAAPPTLAQWQSFLARVDLDYSEHDQVRSLLERSLGVSSREMSERLEEQRRSDEVRLMVRQQRLRSLFEAVPTPLLALDDRDRVVAANPAATGAYGPIRALVGRTLVDVVGDDAALRTKVIALSEDDDSLNSLVIVADAPQREARGRELARNCA
jgi:PAS domain-containing protein